MNAKKNSANAAAWIVVRVRGSFGVRGNTAETLRQLRLRRRNHAIVLRNANSSDGMLQTVRDFVTWGPATVETVSAMLQKRGEITGGKKVTDDFVKKHSKQSGVQDLAKALAEGKTSLKEVDGLKPLFRLNSPKGGYESTKRHWPSGSLGDRGEAISTLVQNML